MEVPGWAAQGALAEVETLLLGFPCTMNSQLGTVTDKGNPTV